MFSVRLVVPAVLWALVACGPVALILWAITPDVVSAPDPGPAPSRVVADATVAGDLGMQAVVTWMGATKDDSAALSDLYETQVATGALPDAPQDYSRIALASVDALGSGLWSVTVAADVVSPAAEETSGGVALDEAENVLVRRFFELAVAVRDGAGVPVTVPAPVPVPDKLTVDVRYPRSVRATSPAAESIGGFLRALLTASGGLDRYVTPGVEIRPIEPAAYGAITVADVRAVSDVADVPDDGAIADVLVTVEAHVDEKSWITAQYRLKLTGRDGRWEVSELQPAPQIQIKN